MIKSSSNILYLSSFAKNGFGGQESLFYLASNLDRSMFNPIVGLPNKGELEDRFKKHSISVKIILLPKIHLLNIKKIIVAIKELLKIVRENNIKIIHTDSVRNTFYAGLIAKLKNIPLIWHIRTCEKDIYDKILYHLSMKIIVVAESLRSRFPWDRNFKRNGYSPRKVITVYNGVDLNKFRPRRGSHLFRKKFCINPDSFLISIIGRFHPMKGQIFLIKAVNKIKDSLNNFVILLAGEIVDEKYMQKCQDLIRKYNLQKKIIIAGFISDVDILLAETDVVVLPSISSEGFPRVIIEAMATGKPVIATDVGGNIEAVENNISGLIVSSKDSNALAEKIYLLGKETNLRMKMGVEARNRAVKFFGIHDNVRKTQDIYQELLLENLAI